MSHEILQDPSSPTNTTHTSHDEIEPVSKPKPAASWLADRRGVMVGVGLGVILTLVGGRILSGTNASSPAPSTKPPVTTSQAITLTEVQRAVVDRTLEVTGTVAATELIPVLSQATRLQIREIFVDEGQTVATGQLLARLDSSVLQAQLAQAQAAQDSAQARLDELLAGSRPEEIAQARAAVASAEAEISRVNSEAVLAQKRLERNQALVEEGAITLDELDEVAKEARSNTATLEQAQARSLEAKQQLALVEAGPRAESIAQARAQLAEARGQVQLVAAQLNDTRVVAPVAGKIARRNARIGDTSTASDTPLFTIIENNRLELQARVPETQLTEIRIGQSVQIRSDSDSKLQFSGQVRAIEPIIDEQSRQAIVKITLPTNPALRPGMFLQAALVVEATAGMTTEMAALLPQTDGSNLAFVLQPDNTVMLKEVKVGAILASEKVEVLSGVAVGDRLVLKGAAYLQDGDTVEVIDANEGRSLAD